MTRYCLLATLLVSGCGGGGSSSPTSPTSQVTTPVTDTASVASPVDQSGCAATYVCPNVDLSGQSNPNAPTIERIALSTGTSETCRASVDRVEGGTNIAVQVTIRNPQGFWFWGSNGPGIPAAVASLRVGGQSAATPGPFASTIAIGGAQLGVPIVTGLTFTTRLTLYTFQGGSMPRTACAVAIYGIFPRS